MGNATFLPNPATDLEVPYDQTMRGLVVYCDLEREFHDVLRETYGTLSASMEAQLIHLFSARGIQCRTKADGIPALCKKPTAMSGFPEYGVIVVSSEVFFTVNYLSDSEKAVITAWYLANSAEAKESATSILDEWVQGASENGIELFTRTGPWTFSPYQGATAV